MVAGSACIPVPSELIMTLGGALAAGAVPRQETVLYGRCLPVVRARWQSVASGFHTPTYIITAIVVAAVAVLIWRYLRARARAGPARNDAPSRPERQSPVVSAAADRTARPSHEHEDQADN